MSDSIPARERPLRFLDVETTGTDDTFHEIVEVGICDLRGRVLLDEKVIPERLLEARQRTPEETEEALEVNGYDELRWRREAVRWAEIAPAVAEHLTGSMIVGWRPEFDLRFARAGLRRAQLPRKMLPTRTIDVMALAWEHLGSTGIQDRMSLWHTCETLGISNEGAHSARADAERARRVYLRLLRASSLSRFFWRLGADRQRHAGR